LFVEHLYDRNLELNLENTIFLISAGRVELTIQEVIINFETFVKF